MPVIGAAIDLGIGMQPRSNVIARRMEECTQFHHLAGAFGAHDRDREGTFAVGAGIGSVGWL